MSIRILLVDDNSLFRQGLAALISTQADFAVIGDLRSGKEAVQTALSLAPDVVLMDIMLAGVNGLDTVLQIKRRQPHVKVILLTAFRTEDYVRAALRAGADGYVLKDASFEELSMSLRSVAMGKKYLSPDVSGHVVDSFLHPEQARGKSSQLEMLTNRERSILQLIAEGRTNRGAAEFLSVSPKTVEKHRASLMHKLGLRNVAELTLVAMEMGLIERPSALSRLMGNARLPDCPA
ncbi:response regulator transcription factor [soil metagenome]